MPHLKSRKKHVSLRVPPSQLTLITRAAKQADMSLNKFIVKTAINAAQVVLKTSEQQRPTLGEVAGRKLMSEQDSLASGS